MGKLPLNGSRLSDVNRMTEMLRIKMRWSGFMGAPGYSIFHFRDFTDGSMGQDIIDGSLTKVKDFAEAIKGNVPNGVKFDILPDVEVIEDTTGALVDVVSGTQGFVVPSSAPPGLAYSGPSGACITWRTNAVRNGRRIRGRTFIVPMHGSAYGTDGTLGDGVLAAFHAAADNLSSAIGFGDLGVWARPSGPGASDGQWAIASGHSISDKCAVLRSRRD